MHERIVAARCEGSKEEIRTPPDALEVCTVIRDTHQGITVRLADTHALLAHALLGLLGLPSFAASPPGTVIQNQAQVAYSVAGYPFASGSNTDEITVAPLPAAYLTLACASTATHPGDTLLVDVTIANPGVQDLPAGQLFLTGPAGATVSVPFGWLWVVQGSSTVISVPGIPSGGSTTLQVQLVLALNTATGTAEIRADYAAPGVGLTASLNVEVVGRTRSSLDALRYAPESASDPVAIPFTQYYTGTALADSLPPALPDGAGLVTDAPIRLFPTSSLRVGQILFAQVEDPDQNRDSAVAESIILRAEVHLAEPALVDVQVFVLEETAPASGVFLGYLQTTGASAVPFDGRLSVQRGSRIDLIYGDPLDGGDTSGSVVLVDPFGRVFDSASGRPIDGVSVTLIDADTDAPAAVVGDDGVSTFPATVLTGSTLADGGGTVYDLPQGGFRFPFVSPGNYRFEIALPPGAGFSWPSTMGAAELQTLPGAPFAIDVGSRGEPFAVVDGPPLNLDLPIDPGAPPLWVRKACSKRDAAAGDFVQYRIEVESTRVLDPAGSVTLTDVLPPGFRYQADSARLDGAAGPNPAVAGDGRTLEFDLGELAPGATIAVTYVAELGAVRPGAAVNTAAAVGSLGAVSNTARAVVQVREELFRSRTILVGRVAAGPSGAQESEGEGIPGVRIYLEDGTYVVTDERGMFHFEGLEPGVHVVQLDLDTLPDGFEAVVTQRDTRDAGRAWSKFVDLQGGATWRVDFLVAPKPAPAGSVSLSLETTVGDDPSSEALRLEMAATGAPIRNVRLTVMPPRRAAYVPESSRLDGNVLPDPETTQGALTYRLGDRPADWQGTLTLAARVDPAVDGAERVSRAYLLFETEAGESARTPVVETMLSQGNGTDESPRARDVRSVQFTGLRRDEAAPRSGETAPARNVEEASYLRYDAAWIESVKPGRAWLLPAEDHRPRVPSVDVGILHAPGETVELFVNGSPVARENFEKTLRNKADSVAFSLWLGIDLVPGDNRLEARVKGREGVEIDRLQRVVHYPGPPVSVDLDASRSTLSANGLTPPVLAVRFLDRDGYPAREGSIGEYRIQPPHRPKKASPFDLTVMPGAPPETPRYTIAEDGIAWIELEPTADAGQVKLVIPLQNGDHELLATLRPKMRDWIVVGLAEGTAGYNTIRGNMESLGGTAADEDLYDDGRVALYAKGRVKGEWLLTLAYDSDKETSPAEGLYGTIDPGTYYTLYGDRTTQLYDAASREKLYLKLERSQFFALFGDFDSGLTQTELARYSRSLTGLKSRYGDERYELIAFASDSDQAFVKDEIRGQGISGPYPLSRGSIVLNSEKVAIQVRDRFRSEVVLSERLLTRHFDYDVDYVRGTLVFREAIFATDESLNQVFIVVDYETLDPSDHSLTFGGRAQVKIDDRLQLGLSHVTEGRAGGDASTNGVDAVYRLTPEVRARVEVARTSGGGEEGNAYLLEVDHQTAAGSAKAYVRELEEGFGLGQINRSESGTRKEGVEGSYRLGKLVSLRGQAFRQEDLVDDATQDVLEAETVHPFPKGSAHAGLRAARDERPGAETRSSNLLTAGATRKILDDRLNLLVEREQPIGGQAETVNYPARTRLGVEYHLNGATSVFAAQEWADGAKRDTQNTVVGLKSTPWEGGEVSTSVHRSRAAEGEADAASLAARQKWALGPRWSLDAGLERVKLLRGGNVPALQANVPFASGSTEDSTATTLGVTYHPGPWLWSTRLDYRDGTSEDRRGVSSSIQTDPRSDLSLLFGMQGFDRDSAAGGSSTTGNVRLGLAYRPPNGHWLVLDRLEWIQDRQSGGLFELRNERLVNNLNANQRVDRWQTSLQYGAKLARETIDGATYDGYTDLTGLETRFDVTPRWDLGLRGSVLHAWSAEQLDYHCGASVGHDLAKNMWLSVGYNFAGFDDRDFAGAEARSRGPFVAFRMKFDQHSLREALQWAGRPAPGTNP